LGVTLISNQPGPDDALPAMIFSMMHYPVDSGPVLRSCRNLIVARLGDQQPFDTTRSDRLHGPTLKDTLPDQQA
jgi:hypothetical protein